MRSVSGSGGLPPSPSTAILHANSLPVNSASRTKWKERSELALSQSGLPTRPPGEFPVHAAPGAVRSTAMADVRRELAVSGTPVSLQAKNRTSIDRWKQRVREAAYAAIPEGDALSVFFHRSLRVWIIYFHIGEMQGDIDNIVKPILDACNGPVWTDDSQIAHLTVRRIQRDQALPITLDDAPAPIVDALDSLAPEAEIVFVRAEPYTSEASLP